MIKKIVILFVGVLGIAGVLSGCTDDKDSADNQKITVSKGEYPLLWTDTEMSDDSDTMTYVAALNYHGKSKRIATDTDYVKEVVDTKYQSKPFIKIRKNHDVYAVTVYRPPYMTYVQNDLKGTVTAKDK